MSHLAVLAAVPTVEPEQFVAVVAAGAVAGTISAVLGGRGLLVPTVVVELVLGVLIGPQVLGLENSEFLDFFADLGLGMLFFFAGYEIDLRRIAGAPLRLAALGWALSLVLAYTIGGILAAAGIVLSLLFTGSALATTAIGTLLPILSDTRRAADAVRHVPARRRGRSASSARSCSSRCSCRPTAPCTRRSS